MLDVAVGTYAGPGSARSFLRYARRLKKDRDEEQTFRLYVAEQLRLSPQGKYLQASLSDLMRPRPAEAADTAEVLRGLVERGGLVVVA